MRLNAAQAEAKSPPADHGRKVGTSRPGLRLLLVFAGLSIFLIASHVTLLRLPYFWDEAGYYVPAARDLAAGHLIPQSTPSNAHPPLVMAWLALAWKIFGTSIPVTRVAMLLLAAFTLTGFFELGEAVAETTVAAASTFLVAIYPVFFAQSSLAHVDLPAAGLIFWGVAAYVRRRVWPIAAWFSLAALAKETAILVPLSLVFWELVSPWFTSLIPREHTKTHLDYGRRLTGVVALLLPCIPLAVWYAYHYAHTGFIFGNPEFLRYNLQDTLHPLRVVLALFLRIWQTVGYMSLYVLTLACLLAMKYPAQTLLSESEETKDEYPALAAASLASELRPRIAIPVQLTFLAIASVYLLALSVLGGAVLARYMLPIVPLFILICVSTIWRRLRPWKLVLAIVAASFTATIFVNPPYGFSLEDNLAYRDYIRLHQRAEAFLEQRYPKAHVLTAWPASDEISRPYLGYVSQPFQVVRIEDFTAEQLLSASDARSRFDVALVFSTKYQAPHNPFDGWRRWQEWKTRYFGYHVDLTPQTAASILGGTLVYVEPHNGQWIGIIELQRNEVAQLRGSISDHEFSSR